MPLPLPLPVPPKPLLLLLNAPLPYLGAVFVSHRHRRRRCHRCCRGPHTRRRRRRRRRTVFGGRGGGGSSSRRGGRSSSSRRPAGRRGGRRSSSTVVSRERGQRSAKVKVGLGHARLGAVERRRDGVHLGVHGEAVLRVHVAAPVRRPPRRGRRVAVRLKQLDHVLRIGQRAREAGTDVVVACGEDLAALCNDCAVDTKKHH